MDFLKYLPKSVLLSMLPVACLQAATLLRNRDANETGVDDVAANLLVAAAPALTALERNDENAFRKSLRIARDLITNYLNEAN